MGNEARRNVDEVRRRIGHEAATAVSQLEATINRQRLEHQVLAREMAELHKLLQAALAAFDEPRKKYAETLERLENVGLRTRDVEQRIGALASRVDRAILDPVAGEQLDKLRRALTDEWCDLTMFDTWWNRTRNRLPWRRRRAQDIARLSYLTLYVRSLFEPEGANK
jgi:hypothetical protein